MAHKRFSPPLLYLIACSLWLGGPAQANTFDDQVQEMYVAYYSRPGDPAGIAWWSSELQATGGNLNSIIDAFGTSAEYNDRFASQSHAQQINNIYESLFGRSADEGGLNFYLAELDSGRLTLASIALDIANGVQAGTDDATIVTNKLTVATAYSEAVATHNLEYNAAQIDSAATLLAAVDATQDSVDTALATVAALSGEDMTPASLTYAIVDTGQTTCYNSTGTAITCPSAGSSLYGQDAQFSGEDFNYTDQGDGTVKDNVTGLIWQQSPDTNGDGSITYTDKLTYSQAAAYCTNLSLAGHDDWTLPTIKQLYSLMDFRGIDPSGESGTSAGQTPFVNTTFFDFAYGDTSAGERTIDAQYASSTLYVSNTANDGGNTLFGLNLADGRIKGYGLVLNGQEKVFLVQCIRENNTYGVNNFADNGDGTISDQATGLMWAQSDSNTGLNFEEALAYVAAMNAQAHLGHTDWRLPNIKELHSLMDYSRSPDTSSSAAIDPIFDTSLITNEAGLADYPFFWSNTTHINGSPFPGANTAYISFGRALGYMGNWVDVHGAGAQRSDPKAGDPDDYPQGHGPQGDAIRIYNYVRLVRSATQE